ncbi:hypothetical protein IBX73_04585 [candidate division WOR-3 bacterium]|nr:hypothetical protein [candidate division WOR-3 bacterium]
MMQDNIPEISNNKFQTPNSVNTQIYDLIVFTRILVPTVSERDKSQIPIIKIKTKTCLCLLDESRPGSARHEQASNYIITVSIFVLAFDAWYLEFSVLLGSQAPVPLSSVSALCGGCAAGGHVRQGRVDKQ